MIGPLWLRVANSYIGLTEVAGTRHNPLIVKMWMLIRMSGIKDDETPWCAGFVGSCLEEAGIKSSRSAAALSYLDYGQKLTAPVLGAIAVKKRRNSAGKVIGGHVFFVAGRTSDGRILGLGGNQNNRVGIDPFDPSGIVAYRYPLGLPIPRDALPVNIAGKTIVSEA